MVKAEFKASPGLGSRVLAWLHLGVVVHPLPALPASAAQGVRRPGWAQPPPALVSCGPGGPGQAAPPLCDGQGPQGPL